MTQPQGLPDTPDTVGAVPPAVNSEQQFTDSGASPTPATPSTIRAEPAFEGPTIPEGATCPVLTPTPEPPDGQVGRPRVLTASGDPKRPGPMELYISALSVGMTRKDACLNALVGYNTVRRALIQGRQDVRRGLDTHFGEFWTATRQAEVRAKFVLAARVYQASADTRNWRAAIAMLERRHPKEYGLTLVNKHVGDENRPVVFRMKLKAGPSAPGVTPTPGGD